MPGEHHSLTEKTGRPQSTGSQCWTRLKWPCAHRREAFFYLQQLCPRESWAWRWRSCLACGDPGSTNCAGIWTASAAGVMALVESFSRPLWLVFLRNLAHSGTSRAPLSGVLVCCLAHQAHRGGPLTGVLFCRWAHQALKGAPRVGSYSVVQCIRHSMGQPLYCSAADAGCGGERLRWWLHPLRATQQYLALLPCLPGFPPQAFPTTISPLISAR